MRWNVSTTMSSVITESASTTTPDRSWGRRTLAERKREEKNPALASAWPWMRCEMAPNQLKRTRPNFVFQLLHRHASEVSPAQPGHHMAEWKRRLGMAEWKANRPLSKRKLYLTKMKPMDGEDEWLLQDVHNCNNAAYASGSGCVSKIVTLAEIILMHCA